MIIDSLKNSKKYENLNPRFPAVFAELKKLYESGAKEGRTEVDGESAFINLSTYTTKPFDACRYEAHRKYIDIQCVFSGTERIDLCDSEGLDCTDAYGNGDIAFFADGGSCVTAFLSKGEFAIIFPEEAHKPCVAAASPATVTKAVAKVIDA